MIFNDGQAFKNMDGDVRAPNVLDNLIYRREIPVMIAVFINPGRRPDQPEPTPQNWGDRDTNRPTEYNTLDDKYARVIVDELMPVAVQGLQHLEGSRSARHRRRQFRRDRRVHRGVGAAERVPQGAQHRRQLHEPPRRPRLCRHRAQEREEAAARSSCRTAATTIAASDAEGTYDETRDWFLQNVRLMRALTEKGYDLNYTWGIGRHGQKQGGAILPDMMRWLWRDHPVSTDPERRRRARVQRARGRRRCGGAGGEPGDCRSDPAREHVERSTSSRRCGRDWRLCADEASILIVPGDPAMTKEEALKRMSAAT